MSKSALFSAPAGRFCAGVQGDRVGGRFGGLFWRRALLYRRAGGYVVQAWAARGSEWLMATWWSTEGDSRFLPRRSCQFVAGPALAWQHWPGYSTLRQIPSSFLFLLALYPGLSDAALEFCTAYLRC